MTGREREAELREIILTEGKGRVGGKLHIPFTQARDEYLLLPGELRVLNIRPTPGEQREMSAQCFPPTPHGGHDDGMLRVIEGRRRAWEQRFPGITGTTAPPRPIVDPVEERRLREERDHKQREEERERQARERWEQQRVPRLLGYIARAKTALEEELAAVARADDRAEIVSAMRDFNDRFYYLLEADR
jgi:hypothetical protein